MDVSLLKHPYANKVFSEEELALCDPFILFEWWFKEALESNDIIEPQAVCLSTATSDGKPSSRYVLMKSFSNDGLIFYSNYESRKGVELENNPHACMLFYWKPLYRQIRIEGRVKKIPNEDSITYFKTRSKASQASCVVSRQSQVASSYSDIEAQVKEFLEQYSDTDIPKPVNWGGYLLQPSYFEFWRGHTSRLHDRIAFSRKENDGEWNMVHLYP